MPSFLDDNIKRNPLGNHKTAGGGRRASTSWNGRMTSTTTVKRDGNAKMMERVVLDHKRNQKREAKLVKKEKEVVVIKEFPSLKNRCSPGSLLGVIQALNREQKECVRAMGFGSLLRMKMIDVQLKIVYYVLYHFNFETLKVGFENCQVSVDSKSVHEMLGLPSGGSLLSNMDYISENNEESYVNEPYVEEECQESQYNEDESGGDEDEFDGDEDLCDENEEEFDVNKVSVVEVYEKVNLDEDYGNDFLNGHENIEDDDQVEWGGAEGGVNGSYEDNIDNDLLNEKNDEDDEQGNGSECNEEEAMNLNSIVENVTKSVGLIDSQEGVSFSQFMYDPVVESFLKTLDQGTANLVDGCINHKRVDDNVNGNLTGTINFGEDDHNKEVISDHTVDKVIVEKKKENELIHPSLLKGFVEVLVEISKAKNDGEGVVEGEDVEVVSDLGKAIEDCSNKNKDGETAKEGFQIIQWKDSNETQSLKKDKAEEKVEKFYVLSFILGFSHDSQGSKKACQSESSPERMTNKKIKDRVYLAKPSARPKPNSDVPNVDVIDVSLVFLHPLWVH
ncbi:unnamed protein product [Lactuca virosa]|uniref:Uncharacterized protein n=1 Tax=Lactuca virosa TaxID=75947 RepID=A0AAU9NHP0_9ASTR|nr:unnamed protein product [Lactuca virosa]